MNNIIKKIFLIIVIFMISYNLASTLLSMFDKKLEPKLGNIRIYRVDDNLMAPELKQNYITIIKKCNETDIKKGEIILFWENDNLKIERVMNIDKSEISSRYITKGDNAYYFNEKEVEYNNIEGKVIFKIPLLGIISKIIESKITTIFILIILVIMFVFNRDMQIKSNKRRKIKQNQV